MLIIVIYFLWLFFRYRHFVFCIVVCIYVIFWIILYMLYYYDRVFCQEFTSVPYVYRLCYYEWAIKCYWMVF